MQIFSREALGTRLEIKIDSQESCDSAFLEIERWTRLFENRYSRFIPGNWLDKLNREDGGILDSEAREMLEFALELAEVTQGIFDPTLSPALEAIGYGIRPSKPGFYNNLINKPNSKKTNLKQNSYSDVILSGDCVRLNNGAMIEFGGVGKGYALERIANMLSTYDRYLIDFGGDIYGKWGWKIGLEDPQDTAQAIGTIELEDGYFCSSSGAKRRFGNSHHLLDARTGDSTSHLLGTFIESDSGLMADGFATACFIVPIEQSIGLFEKYPIEGALLTSERQVYRSKGSRIELFWI